MSRAAALLLVLAVGTGAPLVAASKEREHRVAPGESASALAKRYYGDVDLGPQLLAFNDKSGTVLRVGETLRLPVCAEHEVRAGDTGSVLAQRYLGRSAAWPSVARLNGLAPQDALRVGQELVFPVIASHELRRGETLGSIAERFYGDRRRADVLREFNGIEDPRRLSVGQTIEVPLVTLREARKVDTPRPEPKTIAVAAEPPAPSPVPPEPVPTPEPRRFIEPLAEAASALANGHYEDVRASLEALREPVSTSGSLADRVALWNLLLALHVAYDEAGAACEAWHSLVELDRAAGTDPDAVSPKVRETIARCAER